MMSDSIALEGNWGTSSWLAIIEFAIVILIFVADWHHHIFFSKTPYLFLLGWLSLRLRKRGWKSVGLVRYRNWATMLALGLAGGVAMSALELLVTQPLLILDRKTPGLL